MNLLNKLVVATLPAVPKPVVRYFASRYIAGESTTDAVRVVRSFNGLHVMTTLDVLGEDIHSRQEALSARQNILDVLAVISRERLDSNVSIKLTQLGLKLERSFCLENARVIVEAAKDSNNFVRVDMEDSSCTDDTLWVYRELGKRFSNIGVVLQAYLRRTEEDAKRLIADGLRNFRLCKGIYIEPESIAFKNRNEINRNFMRVLELMFRERAYVGIATHDQALIGAAYTAIGQSGFEKSDYEFQMLLGVRPELRSKIIRDGHRIRVYVPFGKHWYQYSIRRFKENPQIAGQVFRSILKHNHSLSP